MFKIILLMRLLFNFLITMLHMMLMWSVMDIEFYRKYLKQQYTK